MASAKPVQLEVLGPHGPRSVRLSSPDRVLWPQAGITKLQLAQYVQQTGAELIAALGDRPLTLQRFPDGVQGEQFFSKNPPKGAPDWVRTVTVTYPSGRRHQQLVPDEPAALVWAVQMNTITFHPWPVRTGDPDCPDELRIDLDPQPGCGLPEAVRAAQLLRELLAELGLTAWVKTSGNRGLHVHAAIAAEHEFLDVRHAVIGVSRELERRAPQLVTTAWWKEERGERVFLDYNQTNRDRTMAGAYSPRPLPHAPVSTPVEWDELEQVDPQQLTVLSVPSRLAQQPDPWAGFQRGVGDLGPALALWQADLERGLGELPFPPDFPKMPGEPKRARPSVSRADTSGIPEREWYADPQRWQQD